MNKYKLILLALSMTGFVQAKVTLPAFFTDNMVVQQNSTLTLPGKAKAGKNVTVKASWNDNKFTTKATADGSFRIEIPTPAAGGPYTITISDGETLTLKNVLAGEVWFCSGQSNMEMPVAGWGKVMNYEQEVAEAKYPSIRLLQVKKNDFSDSCRKCRDEHGRLAGMQFFYRSGILGHSIFLCTRTMERTECAHWCD